jgi:aflatoxin B1 aldehyde reductase
MASKTRVILGTMTFGPQLDLADSRSIVHRFLEEGYHEIDTAHVYNDGDSEKYLGAILSEDASDPAKIARAKIATKVNPRITGRLDADSVVFQVNESLRRLQTPSVDILYLHFPDPATPIEVTLAACADLHRQGKFRALGLSNFPAWEVVHIWHLCQQRGWPVPEVYQGLYNGLSRSVESELLPALRQLGMRFYAYNPLAGGILAGKYSSFDDVPSPGRFTFRPNYRQRYWKQAFFEAIGIISENCANSGITLVEAAYRWLAFHSSLQADQGDGVILGVSRQSQLDQNLSAFQGSNLPEVVVTAFESAWDAAKPDSPAYFRTSS